MAAKRNKKGDTGSGRRRPENRGAGKRPSQYEIEFYEDVDGTKPVLEWIKGDLSPTKRRAIGTAMREVLQAHGVAVCKSSMGKQLGGGIFEFRLRTKSDASEKILLRVLCHAYGNKVILLLAGYDKGEDPSNRRQQDEIALAQKRLKRHKGRLNLEKKRQKDANP